MNKFALISLLFFLIVQSVTSQLISKKSLDSLDFDAVRSILRNSGNLNKDANIYYADYMLERGRKNSDTIFMLQGWLTTSNFVSIESSNAVTDSILSYSNHQKFESYRGFAYLHKAINDHNQYKYETSLSFLDKAEKIAVNNHKRLKVGVLKWRIFLHGIADEKEAKFLLLKEIISLIEENQKDFNLNDHPGYLFDNYRRISYDYLERNNYDSAQYIIKKGINKSLKINNKYEYLAFLKTSSCIDMEAKYYQKSVDTVLKLRKADPSLMDVALNLNMALCYKELGKLDSVHYFMLKTDSIYKKHDLTGKDVRMYLEYFIAYHKKNENPYSQLSYINSIIRFDSINKAKNAYFSDVLNAKYRLPELLEEKSKILNQLNKEKNRNTLYFWIGVVFAMALVWLTYYMFIKTKKSEAQVVAIGDNEKEKQTEESVSSNDLSEEVTEYISQRMMLFKSEKGYLNPKLSMQKMANEIGTNTSYLSKWFNEVLNLSFKDYINGLRIEESINKISLIEDKESISISDISEKVGYSNTDSFTRAFKKHMGVTPSKYLKDLES